MLTTQGRNWIGTMHRDEKRRKFHEALVNMLYPPPPSPPHPVDVAEESKHIWRDDLIPDLFSDGKELKDKESCSSDEESEREPKKLTRAQRKRLRRKKIQEAASSRRKIIGPLSPMTSDVGGDHNGTQHVRHNDTEEPDTKFDKAEEQASSATQKKLKHRRIAKKLAREGLNSLTKNFCQDHGTGHKD